MTAFEFLSRLEKLFNERGVEQYGGEQVSQLEHALQTAWEAEKAGASPDLVVAALLHDVGHLLHGHADDCADQGIDDHHEELGTRYLSKMFGPAIAEPIRLHVSAKRFLCATEPAYRLALSPASALSLRLQGGPMSPDDVQEFRDNPYGDAAVLLRRWDDSAMIAGLVTPPLAHFRAYLELCCGQPA